MKRNNCLQCGQEFEAKRKDKKYCSDSCKQQAYKNRKNGDSIGNVEDNTPKVNPAVFPFLKDYLKGLLSDTFSDDNPSDSQVNLEQVRISKSGLFTVETMSFDDINKLNQLLFDGKKTIIHGRTQPVNMEKVMFWDCKGNHIPVMHTFQTYKILIPYNIVREQLKEYSDNDLIIE